MKDNFSAQSKTYAAYRPHFPEELYQFIYQHVKEFGLAWDVATGNGQSAVKLAKTFKDVIATDISENQLLQAEQLPNISYRKESAEQSSLEDHSADLINISQAIHWFDFDAFYKEVRRVAKSGAVIAAYCYSMFHAENEEIDELIHQFYADSTPYWDAERHYIDEKYQTIPFPFEEIQVPTFSINYEWTTGQVLGYFESWSANQKYKKQFGKDLADDSFIAEFKGLIGTKERIKLSFPVHVRMGMVN